MNKKLILPLLMLMTGLLALPSHVVLAETGPEQSPTPTAVVTSEGDQLVFGSNFTLAAGEVVNGDLSVFGGNAKLDEGSRVKGDVNIFGGNVDVLGNIDGDINVIGGNVNLRSSAKVGGKQNIVGGNINRDRGASTGGSSSETGRAGVNIKFPAGIGSWFASILKDNGGGSELGNWLRRSNWRMNVDPLEPFKWLGGTLSSALLITVLAIAAMAIFPQNYTRMIDVAHGHGVIAGGVGALTWVAVPILMTLMTITLCLIPLAIITALGWVVAIILGWIVAANVFGAWLLKGLGKNGTVPIAQTALGGFVLAFIGALPVLGWLIGFGASSLGLGALILTRFGTQPYPRYYRLGQG